MPVYRVKCEVCGEVSEIFRKMSEYDDLPYHCEKRVTRQICAPAVHAAFEAYVSPATGKFIESRDAQREDLKASNSFLAEPGIEKDIARNREATQEKLFKPIAEAVDSSVARLVQTGQIES